MATAGGLEIHAEIAHAPDAAAQAVDHVPDAADQALVAADWVPVAAPIEVVPLERPRSSSKLTAVPFIAFAIIALLVAGVATALTRRNESPTTPLALVQASASTTTAAKTAQVSISISGGGGLFKNFSETGGFDFGSRRFRVEIDMAQFGEPALGKVDGIADYSNALVEYVQLPAAAQQEAGGKSWIKIDLQALLQRSGIDANLGALLQGQSSDPTQGLGMVRGAENVVKVGTEQIRGVDTTHYHLDVNLQKAVQEQPTPEARDAMQQFVSFYTVPTRPLDVWLDGDGHLRQIEQTLDFSVVRFPPALASKASKLGKPTVIVQYYGFGNPVDTKLPPPDQVIDGSTLTR